MCHVSNIGIDGEDIFGTDEDRIRFENLLGEMLERHGVETHAYALMSNHFHLLLQSDAADPSAAMKDLQSKYAKAFNWRTRRSGPLFVPRFWAKAIDENSQLLQTVRYIHRNPLDIVGTRQLALYRWSSLGTYTEHRPPPEWLNQCRLRPMLDPIRHLEHVITPQPADRLPYAFLAPQRTTSCEEVDRAVDAVTLPAAHEPRHRMLRITVAELCRAGDIIERAHHFGVQPDTLRNIARRGRNRFATDLGYARLRDRVLRAMT